MSIANVLLVDDEVSFVDTFSERLVMRNLEISKAFSGEEALQVLEANHSIEAVILDVKMPGMNGIAVDTEQIGNPVMVFPNAPDIARCTGKSCYPTRFDVCENRAIDGQICRLVHPGTGGRQIACHRYPTRKAGRLNRLRDPERKTANRHVTAGLRARSGDTPRNIGPQ